MKQFRRKVDHKKIPLLSGTRETGDIDAQAMAMRRNSKNRTFYFYNKHLSKIISIIFLFWRNFYFLNFVIIQIAFLFMLPYVVPMIPPNQRSHHWDIIILCVIVKPYWQPCWFNYFTKSPIIVHNCFMLTNAQRCLFLTQKMKIDSIQIVLSNI